MQRILYSFLALFVLFVSACSTPAATTPPTTTTAVQPDMSKPQVQDNFRAMPPEPGPAPEIKLGDFQDFELDNGLQVVLVENHKLPRVSYQLYVDVPPHLEGEYAGANQLLGSMLRRATSDMSKEEIDEAIDFIGASLNTGGSGAFATTISKYKEQVIGLMAKVILDAQFPAEEFDKVKQESKAGLAQELTTPASIANRVRQAVTYGLNHPYGEQMTEETLENIDLDVVKSVYDRYFVPNRSYLVMVGDLDREEAERLAKENFGDWARKDVVEPTFPTPQAPEGVTVNFVPRPGSVQSNIIITNPIELQPGSKEVVRASLLDIILGGSFNGRLYANLREDKGYTYGASSALRSDPLVGSFRTFANVRNEVTDSAIVEFMYELERLNTEPVTEEELTLAQSQIAGSFGRALENPQQIASYALNTVRYDLDRDFYPEYLQVAQNSSLNDVQEVGRKLIDPKNTHIIVVGDKAVAEKLERFATSGKVNYYDVNGVPVDMEDMAAPSDITPQQLLEGYARAIGGLERMKAVKNTKLLLEGDVQGQTISQSMIVTNDGRMSSQTSMMGQVMADQRYNQGKASIMQMGQKVPVPEEMVASMGEMAVIFPELSYLSTPDKVKIEGSETIDGRKAIILAVETGMGTVREYYDAETMLKLRTARPQGPQTVIMSYGNYQEVDGIMFPTTMKMEGMAPFPIELKATEVKVDAELEAGIFDVD